MSQLIRLVYASRSSFGSGQTRQGLDPGVARILAKSRKNNARLRIVGGLLFGDGYFLQCLEGEADVVRALYRKIAADDRHHSVQVLSEALISSRSFSAWSMKYVPGGQGLPALLQSWGLTRFDPYGLSAVQIAAAVAFMQSEADVQITLPGELDAPMPTLPARKAPPAIEPRRGVGAARQVPDSPSARVAAGPNRTVLWVLLAVVCLVGVVAGFLSGR